jgi:hypothetical protein
VVRKEELEVLDRLEAEFWRIISSTAANADPDLALRAGGRILEAQTRRAKLLGLEAPKQIGLTLEADDAREKAARERAGVLKLIREGMIPDEREQYLVIMERARARLASEAPSGDAIETSASTDAAVTLEEREQ